MEYSAVDSGIVMLNTKPALLIHRTVIATPYGARVFSKGIEEVDLESEEHALKIRTSKRLFLEYSACLEAEGLVFLDGSLLPPKSTLLGEWELAWRRLITSQKRVLAFTKDSFLSPPDVESGVPSPSQFQGKVESFFYRRLPWEPPFRVDLLNIPRKEALSILEKNLVGTSMTKFLPTEVADFHARIRDHEISTILIKKGIATPRRSVRLI